MTDAASSRRHRLTVAAARHPVVLSIGIVLLLSVVVLALVPWGFVSDVRERDARLRAAVAPIAEGLEPMYAPPRPNGWDLRVTWFCDRLGLAEHPLIPVCSDVAPEVESRRALDFSFRTERAPRVVCRELRSLMGSTEVSCVAGEMRFGARFYELEGTLPDGVVADVQIRRALVAPRGGIVDPEHPHPGATVATVVSVKVSGGSSSARG